MIIARYICKEILGTVIAISFVLVIISILGRSLTFLAQAAEGKLDAGFLLMLMALRLPTYIQLVLPLALLLSIMLTLGRMHADSEIKVITTCGVSEARLFRIVFVPSLLAMLIISSISLTLAPWCLGQSDRIIAAQTDLTEFDILRPGLFQNVGGGKRTTYAKLQRDEKLEDVFVFQRKQNDTIRAREARLRGRDGERFMLFQGGSVLEGQPGLSPYTIVRYSQLGIRLTPNPPGFEASVDSETLSTLSLLSSTKPEDQAELQWRIALIAMMPILAWLAVPLCRLAPSQDRFSPLAPGLAFYLLYFGVLLYCKNQISSGNVPGFVMWAGHAPFILAGILQYRRPG